MSRFDARWIAFARGGTCRSRLDAHGIAIACAGGCVSRFEARWIALGRGGTTTSRLDAHGIAIARGGWCMSRLEARWIALARVGSCRPRLEARRIAIARGAPCMSCFEARGSDVQEACLRCPLTRASELHGSDGKRLTAVSGSCQRLRLAGWSASRHGTRLAHHTAVRLGSPVEGRVCPSELPGGGGRLPCVRGFQAAPARQGGGFRLTARQWGLRMVLSY